MRFAFIATEKACYPVALMCRVLKVSRAGYYAWSKRPASQHTQEDQRLGLQVAAIYHESRGRYGSPRVHAELRERGQRTARKRVARLMQTAGLRARERRRFRCTTDSRHGMAIKQNLLERRFTMSTSNRGWVTDITYVWTREGWLYLAVILDLFSRRVVGWSLSERWNAASRWTPSRWHCKTANRRRACCITRIAAASMPATIISSCWRFTASNAA